MRTTITVILIAALCAAGACAGPGAPIGPSIPREGGGSLGGGTAAGMLAFLVHPSGGTLSGTVSVAASSGVAFFDTLVIGNAGSGYTLVASAPGFGSIVSAPFTVFRAIGTAAR